MAQTATKSALLINGIVFKLFNAMIPSKSALDFKEVNEFAVTKGYLVHPDLCSKDTIDVILDNSINYNATFYKKWSSVINKSRFELYIDQLKHYASTYGTNHTGTPYLPDEEAEVPAFTTLKVIVPISKQEVLSRCEKMFYSGIALSEETINLLFQILSYFNHSLNIELVKNKEAKMRLYKETDTVPTDAVEMVRYILYLYTGQTLLIKDKKTLAMVKTSAASKNLNLATLGFDEKVLASVFFRFKPLFLVLKSGKKNSTYVNKLRKLANKFHKPMEVGFFESILSKKYSADEILKRLDNITNFKKILLLQTISVRLKQLSTNVYLVRNQKVYIKEKQTTINATYLNGVYTLIYANLINSLSQKACKVTLPKGVNLTLPTSEKSFVGNYPLGSNFDLSETDAIVGINWKGVDGASDLDLSLIDVDGKKYGWNAAYKNANNSVVYSGDMTYAEPEATELFFASKGFKPSIVKVNLFSGEIGSAFKFFIAKEKIKTMNRNYMVDPNNVLAQFESTMDSREKSLGVITDNKFILAQFRTGNGMVSRQSVTEKYTEYALSTLDTYLSLEKVLTDAGFTITDENADLDLSNITKDALIGLLSK